MNPGDVEELGRGRFLRLVSRAGWEFTHRIDCEGVVVIVPVTDAGELVLVEQFRGPLQRRVVELPAGLAGDDAEKSGEGLLDAARRELLEETGFEAERWEQLLEGPVSPGMSSETVTLFRARGLRRVHPGGGDDTEDITVHLVPLGEIEAFVRRRQEEHGCAVDPKVFAGAWFARS